MTESFILGGLDLLDTTMFCDGAVDLGAPVPVTQAIANLLADGSIVTGERTDNRTLVLPVTVKGATYDEMVGRMNTLAQAIDSQIYQITWTPTNARPVVFDCFRGAITFAYDRNLAGVFARDLNLVIPAYPFTRPAQIATAVGGTTPLVIDEFDSLTGITGPAGNWTRSIDTVDKVSGTGSLKAVLAAGQTGQNSDGGVTCGPTIARTITVVSRNTDSRITLRFKYEYSDVNAERAQYSWYGPTVRVRLKVNGGAWANPVESYYVNGTKAFDAPLTQYIVCSYQLNDLGLTPGASLTSYLIDFGELLQPCANGAASIHTAHFDALRFEGGDATVTVNSTTRCGTAVFTTVGPYRAPARIRIKQRDNGSFSTGYAGILLARVETSRAKHTGFTHALLYKTGADKPALWTVTGPAGDVVKRALPASTTGRWALLDTAPLPPLLADDTLTGYPKCTDFPTLVTLGGTDAALTQRNQIILPKPCDVLALAGPPGDTAINTVTLISPDGQQSSGQVFKQDGTSIMDLISGRAAFFLRAGGFSNTFFLAVSGDYAFGGDTHFDLVADYYPRWLAERTV